MAERDYKREWQLRKSYDNKPSVKAKRNSRKRARYLMIKKHGKAAVDGKDIDHKNRNANDNSTSNLCIKSKKSNRGWRKGQKGKH